MADGDLERVLQLNADHVELLSELDRERLVQLRAWASRADVVVCDGEVAGFVLVFSPGTPYDSPNYRWFTDAYGPDFDYLDRIVIDDRFRRLTLEVNLDPPNEPSLAFHRRRGYQEVAQLGTSGHIVSLMAKELYGRGILG
jgi:predicted GNAT superfamily acetyltransferase